MKKILAIAIVFLLSAAYSFADESLEDKLANLAKEGGKDYLRPLVTAFGTDINTGWLFSAKASKPLRFGITLSGIASFVPDDDKTFIIENPDTSIYKGESTETATVFGDKGGFFAPKPEMPAEVDTLWLPNGVDFDIAPIIAPQIFIGLPKGFEVTIRGLPPVKIDDEIGDLSFWGIGLKHEITTWIPLLPINIALQGAYQSINVGDVATAQSTLLNATISKEILSFTFYGGVGIEHTTSNVDYKYTYLEIVDDEPIEQEEKIEFDMDGENEFRFNAGLRYHFLLFDLCADYSFGKYSVLRLGLGASF